MQKNIILIQMKNRVITVGKMPRGQKYITRMDNDKSLYYKTKYWNTKKALYLLFILSSDAPKEIKHFYTKIYGTKQTSYKLWNF
jgi:hypothetical protein